MVDYEKEMIDQLEKYLGKPIKTAESPGMPGTFLQINHGDPIDATAYRSIVGKIMHWTRKMAPETANAMRELTQHTKSPGAEHWEAVKRFVGYVKGRKFKYQVYRKPKNFKVTAYFDANYASNTDDRKSVSGGYESIDGKCLIASSSQTQKTVSLSTTQAEYQSASKLAQGVCFTQQLVDEVMGPDFMEKPARFYGDNAGCNFLIKNEQVGPRTKHIDVRHHWLRDLQRDGQIENSFRSTERMVADINTKNTSVKTFIKHATNMRNGTVEP